MKIFVSYPNDVDNIVANQRYEVEDHNIDGGCAGGWIYVDDYHHSGKFILYPWPNENNLEEWDEMPKCAHLSKDDNGTGVWRVEVEK